MGLTTLYSCGAHFHESHFFVFRSIQKFRLGRHLMGTKTGTEKYGKNGKALRLHAQCITRIHFGPLSLFSWAYHPPNRPGPPLHLGRGWPPILVRPGPPFLPDLARHFCPTESLIFPDVTRQKCRPGSGKMEDQVRQKWRPTSGKNAGLRREK